MSADMPEPTKFPSSIGYLEAFTREQMEAYATARVAASQAEIADAVSARLRTIDERDAADYRLGACMVERDAALAREKVLRATLTEVLALPQLAPEFGALNQGIGTRTPTGIVLLNARAALNQPPAAGDSPKES